MVEIIPAILAKNFEDLQQKIKSVEPYVEWVQLDVSDGKFTTMKTWHTSEDLLRLNTKLNLEVHLMISEPENEIDKWIASGVKRILLHIESTEKLPEILEKIKISGLETGLVLNLQTPIEVLDNFFSNNSPQPPLNIRGGADIVQLMGIQEIGYYGHPFSERVVSKIFSLRSKYQDIKIAVDGGINKETAPKAAAAGADILVAGSAIFGSQNIKKAIEELNNSLK
ncbi:MAG: hypothetical protein A2174_01690 [Candidatus Portnoybacteria bacterium RBG_13_41_18]|uniref:Ribulose-phosphate 3-epimerase n=1 Tax=Candidatus Portnoybacteria bacterium RBG_13_41_18 TaxID=1801991 RepID=A0A1G2FAQ5_9BACT|nr:MAG: hypothetical protein A2174_01690 [Candidatus Portnoybacteria bacterium RBG_13_41_18]